MEVRGQLLRFALVGAVNTGTYYGLYLILLTWLPYVAAHVLAFVLSMIGSFFLTSYFTYRTRPTWRKFLLFPLTNAANFTVTTAGVYLLVDVWGMGSRYAPLIAAAAAIPITFVVSRTIMLRPDGRGGGDPSGPAHRGGTQQPVQKPEPSAMDPAA
ncbi:GtrA family protein [Streptomyces sp. NPDC056500]|uniref:GtrA family protein n=1 Tax=Streptomyces sp. NPDC056500 TaxID=3345840 RepID=UPI0036AFC3DA